MRYLILLGVLSLISCRPLAFEAESQSGSASNSTVIKADQYLTKLTELKKFNGAVLLQKDGQTILKKAYNINRDTTSMLHIGVDSQFDLRSVAKLFAKASLIKLIQEGSMSMDDPLDKHLPNFPNGETITIKHLMDHTAGLPRELNTGDRKPIDLSPEEVVTFATQAKLEFAPGAKGQYSNVGFQLLYYLIGMQYGTSFDQCLREMFFTPLDMHHTGGNFETGAVKTDYAFGHFLDHSGEVKCACTFPDEDMQMGHLYSTVDDMARFIGALDTVGFAGLFDQGSLWQAGGTDGKRAYVEKNARERYSIIFLANYDAIPFEQLVEDLQKLLKGEPITMPTVIQRKTTDIPVEILRTYVGTYDLVDAGHLKLSIRLEQDRLYVYQNGQNNGALYPESERVFFVDSASEESIRFMYEEDGSLYMMADFQGVAWKGIKITDE